MLNIPAKLSEAVDPDYGNKVEGKRYTAADRNWQEYIRCRDNGHTEYVASAKKCDDFYKGDQWTEEDLAALAEAGRPALTINKILSTINTVLGEQRTRRADFQFKPAREASQEGAVALTKLAIAEAEANQLDALESEVFDNGIIEDRGYFDARMNFDDHAMGEIEITSEDNRQVLLDPQAKHYDPRKWPQVIVTHYLSLDEIEAQYGEEKRAEIEHLALNGGTYTKDSVEWDNRNFGEGSDISTPVDAELNKSLKRVRVIDRQWHKHVRVFSLVEPTTGRLRKLPLGTKRKEAMALGERYGAAVVSRTEKRVRWTISADHILLHDDWSIYRTFTIIPYFAIYRPGKPLGLVKNLISPQEQLNKLESQELHVVNTTANSGWIIEEGSLSNMTEDELATAGSKSGVVIKYNPGKKAPEKIKPNPIPTGLDRVSTKAAFNIKEISGVNDSLLGAEKAEVSGIALAEKKSSGLTQMNVPMENLARTRHLLGLKMLELFQDFYTEERIIYITNESQPGAPSEPFVVNEVQDDGQIKNDITFGRYELAVSTQPARDTFNDSQLAEALNLRQMGVNIPDHRVIEYSNLAKKAEVAEEARKLQGLTEPSEEEIALANFQQEIAIQTAVAELQKLQTEIAEKAANVDVLRAKAADLSAADQMELEKLEQELSVKQMEFDLRRQLAVISATNKLDVGQMATNGAIQKELITSQLNPQRGQSNA